MHLRRLNLPITSVVSHITGPPSTTTALDGSTDNANINAIIQVVTTIIIIIMAVVFVGCALFYCFNRTLANGCCGVDRGGEEDEPDNNGNGRRRRRPPGLSRAVIDTFPTYLYSDVRVHRLGNDELECAVCLNEFKDVEILRVLPTCCHVFHPDCIDTWLLSRATCPVCRANVGSISNLTEHEGLGRILGITGFDDEHHNGDEILIEQSPVVQIRTTPPDTSTSTTRWLTCNHPKSHSTGHSPMWTTHQTDRFTLRLPEEVRYRLATGAPWPTGGVMGLVSSPRSWYRHPSNIVGWCRNNGIYVIRKNNYHRFRTGKNNNDNNLLCLGEPIPSSNVIVSWSASPKSDGPVDYSTLVNTQQSVGLLKQ